MEGVDGRVGTENQGIVTPGGPLERPTLRLQGEDIILENANEGTSHGSLLLETHESNKKTVGVSDRTVGTPVPLLNLSLLHTDKEAREASRGNESMENNPKRKVKGTDNKRNGLESYKYVLMGHIYVEKMYKQMCANALVGSTQAWHGIWGDVYSTEMILFVCALFYETLLRYKPLSCRLSIDEKAPVQGTTEKWEKLTSANLQELAKCQDEKGGRISSMERVRRWVQDASPPYESSPSIGVMTRAQTIMKRKKETNRRGFMRWLCCGA